METGTYIICMYVCMYATWVEIGLLLGNLLTTSGKLRNEARVRVRVICNV